MYDLICFCHGKPNHATDVSYCSQTFAHFSLLVYAIVAQVFVLSLLLFCFRLILIIAFIFFYSALSIGQSVCMLLLTLIKRTSHFYRSIEMIKIKPLALRFIKRSAYSMFSSHCFTFCMDNHRIYSYFCCCLLLPQCVFFSACVCLCAPLNTRDRDLALHKSNIKKGTKAMAEAKKKLDRLFVKKRKIKLKLAQPVKLDE